MSFWQENIAFVKEVYDYRCSKYLEWMDNTEGIITKVMANTQYTAKEFKVIKDTFTSLCRDLEKEGTKSWLDMMLDKLSGHEVESADSKGLSGRDKAVKMQEKQKLEAMVERHNSLKAPTIEAQSKVAHYSECYAFGDDIHPVAKVLNEQKHLSMREIHPHTMEMVEDQIEKQEKVLRTIENQHVIYDELMKRGAKLKSNPNAPSFLEKEIAKLTAEWEETNQKGRGRLTLLQDVHKNWDIYETKRIAILEPLDGLEEQYKTYKKIYDPKKGAEWLDRKKKKADGSIKLIIEDNELIKNSFEQIVSLAGEDKRPFMEKEVKEIAERSGVVKKVEAFLAELTGFNERLKKMVDTMAAIRAWMEPAKEKLDFITTSQDMTPEDRVKEIFDLQAQVNERTPLMEPLQSEAHTLLDAKVPVEGEEESEVHRSETAMRHLEEFVKIKEFVQELHERVETEAGSITQDQKFYAEFFQGVKCFRPWMDQAETVAKTPLVKPSKLEDAKKLLDDVKAFNDGCQTNKNGLDSAVESRNKMEKQTKTDNEVDTLTNRWTEVKKVADDRNQKVQELVDTWTELTNLTANLTETIAKIAADTMADVSGVEGTFNNFREINSKKVKIIETV